MGEGREQTQVERLREQLERAYEELAGWRAREPDGKSTAQALHEAEQRVAALLDELAQLREQNANLDEGLRHAAEDRDRFMADRDEARTERDEMRRLGREAEMERDTSAHASALLRAENAELRQQIEDMKQEALPHYKRRLDEARAERDEARDAAEHLWFHDEEHGVSHEEARRWYPWLYDLHEQKQAARRREQP